MQFEPHRAPRTERIVTTVIPPTEGATQRDLDDARAEIGRLRQELDDPGAYAYRMEMKAAEYRESCAANAQTDWFVRATDRDRSDVIDKLRSMALYPAATYAADILESLERDE